MKTRVVLIIILAALVAGGWIYRNYSDDKRDADLIIGATPDSNRKEGNFSIIVSAEVKKEAITIFMDLPKMPQWISYPPNFQFEKLTSATIEGNNLSIPLQSGSTLSDGGDKISIQLPRSVIKGAILRLNYQVGVRPVMFLTRDIAIDELVSSASKAK